MLKKVINYKPIKWKRAETVRDSTYPKKVFIQLTISPVASRWLPTWQCCSPSSFFCKQAACHGFSGSQHLFLLLKMVPIRFCWKILARAGWQKRRQEVSFDCSWRSTVIGKSVTRLCWTRFTTLKQVYAFKPERWWGGSDFRRRYSRYSGQICFFCLVV